MAENKKVICYHTHMELNDYDLGDCERLERKLSVYDKVYYRLVPKAMIYDYENRKLLLPAGISANWVSNITDRPIEIISCCDEYDRTSIRLTTEPKNDLQRNAISFLAGEGEFTNYSKYPQLVLNLDTGEGKTYILITLITIKKVKTIIIVNSQKIKQQWIDSLQHFSDIDPKSICDLKGSPQCEKILKKPKDFKQYKVYVTTHDTIRSFGDSHGWDKVHELFKTLKVGMKIYDEAHLEFQNIIRIDCHTNTKFTYYLTATFGRSDIAEASIYNNVFKNVPRYDQKTRTEYKGKPHINYIAFFYNSDPSMGDLARMRNKFGFNRNRYASYQITNDGNFIQVLEMILTKFTSENNMKTLLLLATIESIEYVYECLKFVFPDLKIGIYHSKVDNETKEASMECDLIISTSKSLGTGSDIPNLRCVINTEYYRSSITTEQIVGRLRALQDGRSCFYIETCDKSFMDIRRGQKAREKKISSIVGRVFHYNI